MAEVVAEKSEAEVPVLPKVLVPVPVPLSPRLSKLRQGLIIAAPIAAIVLSWGTAVGVHSLITREVPPAEAAAGPADGVALYAQHCAQCHGDRGDARGVSPLDPPARHFGKDRFKFATTLNGVPTDDDLVYILKNGIPGSAMPAFGHLSEDELRALVGHVRDLTWRNTYAQLRDREIEELGDYDPVDVAERTTKRNTPGEPVTIPASFAAPTPELLATGRNVYVQNCAPCHGQEGRGDGPQVKDLVNENKTRAIPRDLTQGIYKAGGSPQHLYARIFLGIPGTPMPATRTLTPEDMDALIAYIRSLPATANQAVAGRGQ